MKIYLALVSASLKMYFRRVQSIFWALFFPSLIILIFGMMRFGQYSPPDLGIVDNSQNELSSQLQNKLIESDLIRVKTSSIELLETEMEEGSVDAILIIPRNFSSTDYSEITISYDKSKTEETKVIEKITLVSLDEIFIDTQNPPKDFRRDSIFSVKTSSKDFNNQGFKGFLVPGVAAMSIMQSGVLGVVFTLIGFRTQGVLRRLQATPISPAHFILGQLTTRVITIILQTFLLLLIGAVVLGVSIGQGNIFAWVNLLFLTIVGSVLFLSIGLAISGAAPNEDSAAPIANLITFPMLFLSGVFFPLDLMPDWVHYISNVLPLTHLATGLREASLYGKAPWETIPEATILIGWSFLALLISAKTFKWE